MLTLSCALCSCLSPSGGYLTGILSRGNILVFAFFSRLNVSHTFGTVSQLSDHPGHSSPHQFEAASSWTLMLRSVQTVSACEIKINIGTFSYLYRDEG